MKTFKASIWTALALLTLLVGLLLAQPPDSADKDYRAELAAIPPKEPAEALKTFRLRPGFRIELVAAEPLLRSPVAIDFDVLAKESLQSLFAAIQGSKEESIDKIGVPKLIQRTSTGAVGKVKVLVASC